MSECRCGDPLRTVSEGRVVCVCCGGEVEPDREDGDD